MGPRYWIGVLLILCLLGWSYHLGGSLTYVFAAAALASAILYVIRARTPNRWKNDDDAHVK